MEWQREGRARGALLAAHKQISPQYLVRTNAKKQAYDPKKAKDPNTRFYSLVVEQLVSQGAWPITTDLYLKYLATGSKRDPEGCHVPINVYDYVHVPGIGYD